MIPFLGAIGAMFVAHGPAPTAVDVLVGPAAEGQLIRLSRGLSVRTPDGPMYLCQTRWGGPDAPPVLSLGDRALVAGFRGVVSVDGAGAVTPFELSGVALDATRLRAWAGDESRAAAIDTVGNVISLTPGAPKILETLSPAPDSVVYSDGSLLAIAEDQGILRLWTDVGGAAPPGPVVVADAFARTPTLVAAGDQVFVRSASSLEYRLERLVRGDGTLTLEPILASPDPIHGPILSDGVLYALVGGSVHRMEGQTLVDLATPRLTCLRNDPELGLFGCTLPDLVALGTDGAIGLTLFALNDLRPPSLDGLDEMDISSCQLDWYDIASDAGFPIEQLVPDEWRPGATGGDVSSGDDTSPASDAAVSDDDGCTSTDRQAERRPAPSTFVAFTALLVFASLRRVLAHPRTR